MSARDQEPPEKPTAGPVTEEHGPTSQLHQNGPEDEQASPSHRELDNRELTGRALAVLRTILGRTQSEIADEAGVNRVLISRWEQGHARPSDRNLNRVLDALGVTPPSLDDALATVERLHPASSPSQETGQEVPRSDSRNAGELSSPNLSRRDLQLFGHLLRQASGDLVGLAGRFEALATWAEALGDGGDDADPRPETPNRGQPE